MHGPRKARPGTVRDLLGDERRCRRRAQLNREAVVDRHLLQDRIPDGSPSLVPHDHRLRIVEYDAEWHTVRGGEAVEQAPDEGFDPLVRYKHHVHPA